MARDVLTVSEVEIFNSLEKAKNNNWVAQILNISDLTVKNHMQAILRKLNVRNRVQAVGKSITSTSRAQRTTPHGTDAE